MSTARPHRRPSAKVYRRRRLVVLVGLVAVVVVVLLIILKPGSGPTAPANAQSQATTPPATSLATTSATDAAADPAASAAGAQPSAAPADPAAAPAPAASDPPTNADGSAVCAAGNVTVTPVTDSNDYTASSKPQLSFSIVNTGKSACTINAGTSHQVYTITSGTEVYWTSTDCQSGASDTMALLAPGQTVSSTPFEWNRTRSSTSTCDGSAVAAPAGGASYHLNVTVDGIASAASAQFILE